MAKIVLGNVVCILDNADYHKVKDYPWRLQNGRVVANVKGEDGKRKTLFLSRLIMDAPKGMVVDHINHDPLDNRRCNLRVCTQQENTWNSRKLGRGDTTSRYKGVYWDSRRQEWGAMICVDGKNHRLGFFKKEETAAHAYNRAALDWFGEYACVNRTE